MIRDKEIVKISSVNEIADRYEWFYFHSINHKPNRIISNKDSVQWFGYGIYICHLFVGEDKIEIKKEFHPTKIDSPSEIKKIEKLTQYDWDWSKLPESEYEYCRALVETQDTHEMLRVYNTYKLGRYTYCCPGPGVTNHFNDAFDKGIFNEKAT